MAELRIERAESDGDLADVVAVRSAVARLWESGPELPQLRHSLTTSPGRRLYVARLDGEPVGCASAGSAVPGDPSEELPVQADVLPERRRRGVGSALLRETSAYARALGRAALVTECYEDDEQTLAFLARRGFVEIDRQKALVLELAGLGLPAPETPPGAEIVSRAERGGLERGMYEAGADGARDIPGRDAKREPTFEEWRAWEIDQPGRDPRLAFVALVDGEVAGYATAGAIGGVGHNGLTVVRRAHRRRGIARALKLHQLAAAKALGLPRLVTESEERNEPMRRLNASLGYRPVAGAVVLRGPLLG